MRICEDFICWDGGRDIKLSERLSPQEKENILEDEYGIETTVKVEGGIRQMCNLSERIEERAIRKGIEQGMVSLVEKGLLAKEIAADELGITVVEFEKLLENREAKE